jgi:hypothetical protein
LIVATDWENNWSKNWPGNPHMGGLFGFTPHAVISRHDPLHPRGLWHVSLACGSELIRMTCGTVLGACYAVQDDFGNLVRVER